MSAIAAPAPAPLVWVLSPEEAVATAARVEKINARLTKAHQEYEGTRQTVVTRAKVAA